MSDSYTATQQHISLLTAKRRHLERAQIEAERQLLHRLAIDYRAGRLDLLGLYDQYRQLRDGWTGGFAERWNAAMPPEVATTELHQAAVRLLSDAERARRQRPDTDGNWRGRYPLGKSDRCPGPDTSVVYVLYDPAGQPCYVGSTKSLRKRLYTHAHGGKAFTRWIAHPRPSRDAAYDLEERLLRQHKPYLNRKASR